MGLKGGQGRKRGPRKKRGPKKRKTQFSPLLVAKMSKAMITGQAVLFYFWPSIETLLRSAAPGNRKERKQNRKEGKQSGKERKHKRKNSTFKIMSRPVTDELDSFRQLSDYI